MKILDPQAALLTNLEVHHFLENNQPRKPDKKSGAYEPVNLQEYYNVRKDFKRYIDGTTPHIKQFPPPEQFISKVVQRLKKYDLTKTEEDDGVELNFRALAECVIDSLADRFPGDEGEDKIDSILAVLEQCIHEAKPA
ncbi:hypothetical protein DV738_g1982, partial [Chaetothyriales sp. CBS 135597]